MYYSGFLNGLTHTYTSIFISLLKVKATLCSPLCQPAPPLLPGPAPDVFSAQPRKEPVLLLFQPASPLPPTPHHHTAWASTRPRCGISTPLQQKGVLHVDRQTAANYEGQCPKQCRVKQPVSI